MLPTTSLLLVLFIGPLRLLLVLRVVLTLVLCTKLLMVLKTVLVLRAAVLTTRLALLEISIRSLEMPTRFRFLADPCAELFRELFRVLVAMLVVLLVRALLSSTTIVLVLLSWFFVKRLHLPDFTPGKLSREVLRDRMLAIFFFIAISSLEMLRARPCTRDSFETERMPSKMNLADIFVRFPLDAILMSSTAYKLMNCSFVHLITTASMSTWMKHAVRGNRVVGLTSEPSVMCKSTAAPVTKGSTASGAPGGDGRPFVARNWYIAAATRGDKRKTSKWSKCVKRRTSARIRRDDTLWRIITGDTEWARVTNTIFGA